MLIKTNYDINSWFLNMGLRVIVLGRGSEKERYDGLRMF
jgi:hypothetical protein